MLFMNEMDINAAIFGRSNDPVLRKAVQFLVAFKDQVNEHSDGWAHWGPPVKAAAKLMTLIQTPPVTGATEKDLKLALAPIKAFYTRRGYAAGMQMPVVY